MVCSKYNPKYILHLNWNEYNNEYYHCVGGRGDWSNRGCITVYTNEDGDNVNCQCDHLTSFSILLVSIKVLLYVNCCIHRHQNVHIFNF